MKKIISVVAMLTIMFSCFSAYTVFAYDDISDVEDIDPADFNFPVISVTTENGAPILDKTNYVNCTVSVSNTSDEYTLEETVAGIRFRGNSTLNYADKKAYRIKFDKKQDLFGMGKAKSWVLLANAFDKTMVRNAIAFAVAQQLGLEYTSLYQFVNVYLNGECLGLYLLCEQTQTGETRVNIEEDESGKVDTGYLIEFVGNGDTSEDAYFDVVDVDPSLFADGVTVNWRSNVMKFIIKTPEKEFCTPDQIAFISEYANSFNKAILTHDWTAFNEMCDVDSFAKFFIVNTVLNNGDGGYQIYFYKKENGGKVYAGPIWDFDQSSAASVQCTTGYTKWYYGSSNPWFDSFIVWDEFMELARRYYDENIDQIKEIVDYYTNVLYYENEYDFHVNDVIWNSVTDDYWRITDEVSELKTYEENFNHLNQWFVNRISWLDGAYHDLGEYVYNNDATCISDGTESAACKDCDYVSTRPVKNTKDPTKHIFTDYVYNNDGTCFIDGTMTRICTLCDTEETITDPQHKAPGHHTFSEYIYNNDATDTADGTKSAVCTVCGYVDTVPAPGTKLPEAIKDSSLVFTDVKSDSWYKEYVDRAYSYGLLLGMTETEFEPGTYLTRGMFVTVIARVAGIDTDKNDVETVFVDVKTGKYYAGAVKWAYENGIVDGMSEYEFEPELNISREQICTMIVRFAQAWGITLKEDSDELVFSDQSQIHDYAVDAVNKCQLAGIVNGTQQDGVIMFNPRSNATRAEAAKILSVFYSDYIK